MEQICIGAVLLSLSRIYIASRKLPDSCFVVFVWFSSGTDCPSSLGPAPHLCKECKEGIFMANMTSLPRITSLVCLSRGRYHLHTNSAKRIGQLSRSFAPRHRRGLCGEMLRVAFQNNPTLGLVFLHWEEYTLKGGSFHTLVCGVSEIAVRHWRPSSLCAAFPAHGNKAFSLKIRLLHTEEHVYSAFQAM